MSDKKSKDRRLLRMPEAYITDEQRGQIRQQELTNTQRIKSRQQYPEAYERARNIRKEYVPGVVSLRDLACKYLLSESAVRLILRNELQYDPDYTPASKDHKK
jgi:hypothetical protein